MFVNKVKKFDEDEILECYVLSKIIRYNNRTRILNESVSDHTTFVSLFCLKIMADLDLPDEIQKEVLILAALHDAAESVTSDIPHNVKAKFPEIDSILNEIEKEYYEENWSYYSDIVLNPKPLVKAIVKLADSYSVLQYVMSEKNAGNSSADNFDILSNAKKRVDEWIIIVNEELKKLS